MSDFFDLERRDPETGIGERTRRRQEERRRVRRQRRIALGIVLGVVVAALVVFVVLPRLGGDGAAGGPADKKSTSGGASPKASASATPKDGSPSPHGTATVTRSSSPSASSSPTGSKKPTPEPTVAVGKQPKIVQDLVPYGDSRKEQMVKYCREHYGADQATAVLQPKAIVLHYTAGGSYASAHNYFAANTPNLGELPGACAHFIIDKDGTIYQQAPLNVRTRHTIGLNYCAIGIEFVQEGGSGPTWATGQILNRRKQIGAGLRLVAWLQAKYGIATENVLGHGTANSSPLFKDLKGWHNDHVDWGASAMASFKAKLAALK